MHLGNTGNTHRAAAPLWAIVFLLLSLVALPAMAADWYASPAGSDSADCTTAATACQTIQVAINKAGAGDTVHVGQGSYPFAGNRIRIETPGLTLIGEHDPFAKPYADSLTSVPAGMVAPMTPNKAANASVLQTATSGSASSLGVSAMIWVRNVPNVTIKNLYIEQFANVARTGIAATGHVNGLKIVNNYIKFTNQSVGLAIGISVNADGASDQIPNSEIHGVTGAFATIKGNVLEPGVFSFGAASVPGVPRNGIILRRSVGLVAGNQVVSSSGDVRISEVNVNPAHPASQRTVTVRDNWLFGVQQLSLNPKTSNLAAPTVVEGNYFIAFDSPQNPFIVPEFLENSWLYGDGGSHAGSLLLKGSPNLPNVTTQVSNNTFVGFHGMFRALWIKNRQAVVINNNSFTPAAGASDFTAVVVNNHWCWSSGCYPTQAFDVTLLGNTFNGSGVANQGKAIAFVNDSNWNGSQSSVTLKVGDGTLANANHFDSNIGWYLALDDRSCASQVNHDISACNGTSSYPIGTGINYSEATGQATTKAPFRWDIDAEGNVFGGVFMGAMTQAQFDAVRAKTWDTVTVANNANAAEHATPGNVGKVLYGFTPPITTGSIVFSPTSFTWDGNAHAITATLQEDPAASCTVTPSSLTSVGSHSVSATCVNADYHVAGSATVTVAKAAQSISFTSTPPANPVYGGSYSVSATASSGLAVSFSSGSSACSVSGTTVSLDGTGSCVIRANQAGNGNYEAAPQKTQSFSVGQAAGTVTWGPLSWVYDGASHALTAQIAESGEACVVSPASIGPGVTSVSVTANCSGANYTASASATAAITAATGTVQWGTTTWVYDGNSHAITATIAESGEACSVTPSSIGPAVASTTASANCNGSNYTASGSTAVEITQAGQTISFDTAPPANAVYGGSYSVAATASSGLPVSLSIAPASASVCSLGAGVVSFDGVGTCTIHANQAGDANHEAAAQAQQSFAVGQASGTVAWSTLSFTYDGTAHGVTASITEEAATSCTVSATDGNPLPRTNAGSTALKATCNGDNYSVTDAATLTVSKKAVSISLSALGPYSYDGNGHPAAAAVTGDASGHEASATISYTLGGNPVTTPTEAGGYQVTASLDATSQANYSASPATGTLTIGKAEQTITGFAANPANPNYSAGGTFTLSATGGDSGEPLSFASTTTATCTVSGHTVTIQAAGSCSLTADQAGNANYSAAPTETLVVAIGKAEQSITHFKTTPANPSYSENGTFSVSADGGDSGEPVTFASSTPAVCTVSASTVTMLAAGSCTLTADQAGNANYEAAPQATLAVAIGQGNATLSLSDLTQTYDGQPKPVTVTSSPSGIEFEVSYDGSATVPTDAGSYAVVASITDPDYQGQDVTATLTINKATATLSFPNLSVPYDGSPRPVQVDSTPVGVAHEVTYNGDSAAPSAVGEYAVVATITDPNYVADQFSAVYHIVDGANVSIDVLGAPLMSRVGTNAPYTDMLTYMGMVSNTGATTSQAVHLEFEIVRIDDGNSSGGAPMAIAKADVLACVEDMPAWHEQDPNGHHGCGLGLMSLYNSQQPGSHNGRPSTTFRYPTLDQVGTQPDIPVPGHMGPMLFMDAIQFAFKPGEYKIYTRIVGSEDGHVYATATAATTVPQATVNYAGPNSGQVEALLQAQTTLANSGGRTLDDVVLRVTLSDNGGATLTPADAELAQQSGGSYVPLNWQQVGGDLMSWYDPVSGFALPDGYSESASLQGLFHRQGDYTLSWDVVDAADPNIVFASSATQINIGPNNVAFTLSDLVQVYDASPQPITVNPGVVPHTVVYEAKLGQSCAQAPSGNTTMAPTDAGEYCVYVSADAPYSGTASGMLTIKPAPAAVMLDDNDGAADGVIHRSFNAGPQPVTATTDPAGLGYAVTYDGDATAPSAAGSYSVLATINDPNHTGYVSGTLVIATAGGATITVDDTDGSADNVIHRTWDGNPQALTASTTPTGLAYSVTYAGDTVSYPLTSVAPSAVGEYSVVATLTEPGYQPVTATATLKIAPDDTATITLDAATLSATYDGAIHAVTATTTPTGLVYSVTYNGAAVPPVAAGSYAVQGTITQPGYDGSVSGTLTINKASGQVSFSGLSAVFDGNPHGATAVIMQEPGDPAACTITATGSDPYPRTQAGSSAITATCVGTNYQATDSATLTVAKRAVSISLSGLGSFPHDGAAHAATASINGDFAGGMAGATITYNGNPAAPVAVGTYQVQAVLDAASVANYSAAPDTGVITITANTATISLGNLSQTYDGTARPVTVTTSPAGLAYSVSYDGSAAPPTDAGSYIVVASITEPGYSGSLSAALVIARAPTTVTLSNLTQTHDGNPKPVTVTTNPSNGVTVDVSYDGSATAPSALGSYDVVATVSDPNHVGAATATLRIVQQAVTDIAVSIDDQRTYAQYGQFLTYMITVTNVGNQNVSEVAVNDVLPATLLPVKWTCMAFGSASCATAGGNGDVHASLDMPAGSGVLITLDTKVSTAPNLGTDVITNGVTIAANGDDNAANDESTDSTRLVIFRDGFEMYGNGAQPIPTLVPAGPDHAVALNDSNSFALDLGDAWASRDVLLDVARLQADTGDAIRLQALHAAGHLWVRLLGRVAGAPQVSDWQAVPRGTRVLMTGLLVDGEHSVLLLEGRGVHLRMPLPGATGMQISAPRAVSN